MRRSDLVMIDAKLFYEGMNVGTEVFYNYNNNFILLCNKTYLDTELIVKLRHCQAMGWMLYVHSQDVEQLMQESRSFSKGEPEEIPLPKHPVKSEQKHLETIGIKMQIFRDYKKLTGLVGEGLDSVIEKGKLPTGYVEDMTNMVNREIELMDDTSLIQCINMLRQVDNYFYLHSVNVALLNGLMGKWMKMMQPDIDRLIQIGGLFDLGKCRVPKEILQKPDKLTREEFEIVKMHPVYSYEIAKEAGITDAYILGGIRSHHEQMNGGGYPDGLSGERIPILARITAISDVYDAMVATKVYKERNSPFVILKEFSESKFSSLDVNLVDIFVQNLADELVGKLVDLSDGSKARITYINPKNYKYPMVRVRGEVIQTNSQLYCIGMSDFLSIMS